MSPVRTRLPAPEASLTKAGERNARAGLRRSEPARAATSADRETERALLESSASSTGVTRTCALLRTRRLTRQLTLPQQGWLDVHPYLEQRQCPHASHA